MAATLDLYIDTASGNLVDGGSVVGGALPTLTRNDTYTLRLRLLEKQPNGSLDDIDLSSSSLKAAIGNIEEAPSGGSFKLNINGITSSAIPFNATAVCVYNAISNNVSTVALYGSDTFGSYLLTATQPNTAMSFGSDSFTLFPTSSVLVGTRRNPAASIEAQQVVKLVRNPIVYADTFTTASTASELVLTKLSDGGTGTNETYELTVGPRVRGGLFSLNWGGTSTTGIAPFTSAVSVQGAISSGINTITSNISVQENGKQGYIIQFTGRFAQTNITTALQLDASGINFIPFKQTTLTINTAEVEDAFTDAGTDTITPTLEIELTQGGTPKTVFQGDVTIRKDLITVGSTVPGNQAAYYTKSEANALFVEDSTSNVDQTNRTLYDVSANASFDYSNRLLLSNSGFDVVINSTTGLSHQSSLLGFYNSALTAKPSNINVVSGLINLGLIASGTTYGVLPLSPYTVTTLCSVTFGTVASNDQHYRDVVVTGAAVNDLVLLGLPAAVSAGAVIQGVVYKTNTVCLSCTNSDITSVNINTATYRITVIGY
jgi:hypothetical protein